MFALETQSAPTLINLFGFTWNESVARCNFLSGQCVRRDNVTAWCPCASINSFNIDWVLTCNDDAINVSLKSCVVRIYGLISRYVFVVLKMPFINIKWQRVLSKIDELIIEHKLWICEISDRCAFVDRQHNYCTYARIKRTITINCILINLWCLYYAVCWIVCSQN